MYLYKKKSHSVTLIFIVSILVVAFVVFLKKEGVWTKGIGNGSVTEESKLLQAELESVGIDYSKLDESVNILLSDERYLKMAFCPKGIFNMRESSPEFETNKNKDKSIVEFSKDFWIGSTEITQAQWESVMGKKSNSEIKNDNLPAIDVNWGRADDFVETLNKKIKLPEGWRFALPTEAQWQYACEAGTELRYNEDSLRKVAWFQPEATGIREVASKLPNAWGIYDMYGNVAEWCSDWYGDDLPKGVDPTGPESGSYKIIKGGAWIDFFDDSIADGRTSAERSVKSVDLGFRVVLLKANP